LEPLSTRQKKKAEKELEENDVGGSWNSGKELERGQSDSWKQSLLTLLRGGLMFWRGFTGIWLDLTWSVSLLLTFHAPSIIHCYSSGQYCGHGTFLYEHRKSRSCKWQTMFETRQS
jgi:hypothetical protein